MKPANSTEPRDSAWFIIRRPGNANDTCVLVTPSVHVVSIPQQERLVLKFSADEPNLQESFLFCNLWILIGESWFLEGPGQNLCLWIQASNSNVSRLFPTWSVKTVRRHLYRFYVSSYRMSWTSHDRCLEIITDLPIRETSTAPLTKPPNPQMEPYKVDIMPSKTPFHSNPATTTCYVPSFSKVPLSRHLPLSFMIRITI